MINTKRFFDIVVSLIGIVVFFVPMIIISLLIKIDSPGPICYFSSRTGIKNRLFRMFKFRTMLPNTPEVASEDFYNSRCYQTRLGRFLRKYSLDELPQFFNVLIGDMSIVGPRPALYNQRSLINEREKRGISEINTGITGWAQINGREEVSDAKKVELDYFYLKNRSLLLDIKILLITTVKFWN